MADSRKSKNENIDAKSSPLATSTTSPASTTTATTSPMTTSTNATNNSTNISPSPTNSGDSNSPSSNAEEKKARRVSLAINRNYKIDLQAEKENLEKLKDGAKAESMKLLMTLGMSTLFEGIFVTDKQTPTITFYFRLEESETALEYCTVPDKISFEKSSKTQLVNPQKMELSSLVLTEQGPNVAQLTSHGKTIVITADDANEFALFIDIIRQLQGKEFHTQQLLSGLSVLTDVKALTSLYKAPAAPEKPPNFNFVANAKQQPQAQPTITTVV